MKKREIIIGIYKITSPSGGIYIGYTTDRDTRQSYYNRLSCKNQKILYNSLKKYGFENHTFEMIHIFEKGNLTKSEIVDELLKLEVNYIKEYNSFCDDNREFGMNLTRGGDRGERSEITKRKISEKAKIRCAIPENNSFFGKQHTDETKNIIREKNSGENSWNFGKKGDKCHNYGRKKSQKSIDKMLETNSKKPQEERDASILKGLQTKSEKSQEEKDAISLKKSLSVTGDKNPMSGRKHSVESIEKIKETKRRNREVRLVAKLEQEMMLEETIRQEKELIELGQNIEWNEYELC